MEAPAVPSDIHYINKVFDNLTEGQCYPCGVQKDQSDAARAIAVTGIVKAEANIGKVFEEMLDAIAYCGIVKDNKPSVDTRINLPPRLRMAMLFGIGQSIGAFVLNTDNLSERITGYSTFGGDDFGSYAPIQDLTVTEVLYRNIVFFLSANVISV